MLKVLLLILFVCTTGMLCAITRIVDIDGTGQYTTIQSAINASANGDVILVYPGRYIENVVIQTNGIILESLEATTNNPAYIDSTIIDGNATYTCVKVYANIQNIQIQGFSITNAKKNGNGGGIVVTTNSVALIKNCKIFNNIAIGGGGILVAEATVTLSGVEIYNNRSIGGGGGLLISKSPSQVIFDPVNRCSIYNNRTGSSQDIFVDDARVDFQVYLDTFTVANPSNYFAVYFNDVGYHNHLNFHIQNAYFQEINHDMYVSPDGNDSNDGFTPQTALRTIHTAIYRTAADSLAPKTVHILPGTYSITANQQIFPITMKSWVNVVGSGMDNTFIIAEQLPQFPDQDFVILESYYQKNYQLSDMHVVFALDAAGNVINGKDESNVIIKNIKIENMLITYSYLLYFAYLRNCIIDGLEINNVNFYQGSIIYIDGSFEGIMKNWKITNCASYEQDPSNWVDPLIWLNLLNTTIENCLFDNLTMADDDSQCLSFGGSDNPNPNVPITMNIRNCLFSHINGQDGIIHFQAYDNPNINITNSTFADCDGHDYTVTSNGTINIRNSIFINNTPHEIFIYPMSNGEHTNLTMDYNCIQNGQAGIFNPGTGNQIHYLSNNTSANPLFLGGTGIDSLRYSLALGSPCIDAGTPDTLGLFLPVMDLAGNYRIWNNRIDMGCYEFGSEPVGNEDEIHPEVCGTKISTFPNPVHMTGARGAYVFIEFTFPEQAKEPPLIEIFNIKGQRVKSMKLNESYTSLVQKAGLSKDVKSNGEFFSTVWDCRNDQNQKIASGLYLVRVTSGSQQAVRKMMILK